MADTNSSEIWIPIVGYEGRYEVSNYGNVRSIISDVPTIMKMQNLRGYKKIVLWDSNGNRQSFLVHRLVAMAFIPNPNNYNIINHKDEVKSNNYVGNLEWCTQAYNMQYSHLIERHVKKSSIPVVMYDMDGNFVREIGSTRQAARELNTENINIAHCCQKKINYCKGFQFRYKTDNYPLNIGKAKVIKKVVYQCDKNLNILNVFKSAYEAEKKTGTKHQNIQRAAQKKSGIVNGCRYIYSDDYEQIKSQHT